MIEGQVTVISESVVRCDAGTPMLLLQTAHDAVWRPSSAMTLRPLQGFEFFAVGFPVTGLPPDEPAQLWQMERREWRGVVHPELTLNIVRMSITWPDSPICFERQWLTGQQVLDQPRLIRGGATPTDYHRLADAYQALIRFTENLKPRAGRQKGDGSNWPGGIPDFLADLWDTADRYAAKTGRPWPKITGNSGQPFRAMMRGCPADRTLRDWLSKAELRAQDIESGKVTRANSPPFVAEQTP